MENLILDAENIANEIKESEDYKELIRLKKLIDTKYFLYISEFLIAKDRLEATRPLGKDSSIYQSARENYLKKKEALYNLEEVVKYKRYEKKIQDYLDSIVTKIKELL